MPTTPRRLRRTIGRPASIIETLEARVLLSNSPLKLPVLHFHDPITGPVPVAESILGGAESTRTFTGGYWRKKFNRRPDSSVVSKPTSQPMPDFQALVAAASPIAGTAADVRADINRDLVVDLSDLAYVANDWQKIDAAGVLVGDIIPDGIVNVDDLGLIAANWQLAVQVELPPPPPPVPTLYDWHQQVINGVLNVWAPNPSDFGNTFTVTDPAALFGSDGIPQMESIRQGPTADCYFLAAEGGIAFNNPSKIQSIVQNDASGGWAVTFKLWTPAVGAYTSLVVHTSNELSSSLQNVVNGEVWSLVLEKAFCAFRTWNGVISTNTMASIGWGFGGAALTALGTTYTSVYLTGRPDDWIYSTLQNALNNHQPILFHTAAVAPTMVASHVYVITGVSTDTSGTRYVTAYNPWGATETLTQASLLLNTVGSVVIGNA